MPQNGYQLDTVSVEAAARRELIPKCGYEGAKLDQAQRAMNRSFDWWWEAGMRWTGRHHSHFNREGLQLRLANTMYEVAMKAERMRYSFLGWLVAYIVVKAVVWAVVWALADWLLDWHAKRRVFLEGTAQ